LKLTHTLIDFSATRARLASRAVSLVPLVMARSANRDHWPGRPPPPLGGLPPPPEPEPGGKPWPPLPLPLPLDPDDELPPFRFWFGPVGNGPCVLPLPLPPDDELPPLRFWLGPVGNEPFVLLPPPRAIAPETGASRAMPAVAIVTPSIMLSRLVIIVAPPCYSIVVEILSCGADNRQLHCHASRRWNCRRGLWRSPRGQYMDHGWT
jgi:hypothetical protein